jgi:hypothetical protein
MLWLVPVLLTVALSPVPEDHELLSAPDRRVRSADRRIGQLLATGMDRSPTFAHLVRAVNASDVIVYIEPTRLLPKTLAGRLLLLPRAGEQRYLRIQVRVDLPGRELIALIAHELRHALEVAADPTVRDDHGMLALYQRIGRATAGTLHAFDTEEAQIAGRRVRQELVG